MYEFARLCQFIDQILRDVNTKSRNIKDEYKKSTSRKNLNSQKSNRKQSSASRFRSETSKSNTNNQSSNNREMSQAFEFDQINAFICYNCDKADHIARVCRVFRKMNLNNFVRKINEDQTEKEDLKTLKKE